MWPKLFLTPFLTHRQTKDTVTFRLETYVLTKTPDVRPKSEIYTHKQDDEHPRPFHMIVPIRELNFVNLF